MRVKEETQTIAMRIPVSIVRLVDEAANAASRTRTGEILNTLKRQYRRRPKKS